MLEKRKPIAVGEAISRVMSYAKKGESEYVSIHESDRRILAENITATHHVPPFDRSPYDGYAIRSLDTLHASRENPIHLEVIDHIGAGHVSKKIVGEKQAVRIMTGAAIPKGADCVIMLELVEVHASEPYIVVKRHVKKGDNISRKGEDAKKGTTLIASGERITPGVKALLATFGYSKVKVGKRPKVGVIATGTELLSVDEALQPGKIRNSNGYMIESQVMHAGATYITFLHHEDHEEALYSVIKKAMDMCDFVITTGGVSVGDFDLLPAIYERLGAEILCNKIRMRPGSVTTVAVAEGKLLFGLSGNPSACFVGFELYVKPVLRYFQSSNTPYLPTVQATLQKDFPKANPFNRFVRSVYKLEKGKVYVEPTGLDKSSVVTSIAWANCLMVLPGGTRGYQKGDTVDILLSEDETGSEKPWSEQSFNL